MKEISAGGVVFARDEDGSLKIQMIRDRYGKMTLPKGKLEQGERFEEAALREIKEETGITGKIVVPLTVVRYKYLTQNGDEVDKEVHYFLVEATGGTLTPQVEEIEDVNWYTPDEAWEIQRTSGYLNNNEVLQIALKRLGVIVHDD